ncbi:MAG: hypothetical protein FWE91_09690 [Defluviitaleaceae bacterium]|nr:hypothetical protein [Defluviitaleaceae bacterium]
MTSAYLTLLKYSSELRVYNRRNTAHNVAKTENENKQLLKRLGFKWDKYNHSYFLENPTDDAIAEIKTKVSIETNDYRDRKVTKGSERT